MAWNVLLTARALSEVGEPAMKILNEARCNLIRPPRGGTFAGAELKAILKDVDAALCSPDKYSADVLGSPEAARLKIVSRWGVGFDSVDIAAATANGIVVAYTPGFLNEAVADYTFALLLGIARRVTGGHQNVTAGTWTTAWGYDVFGKTLGLVGCGRIGLAVAKRAQGFGMRILGCDVFQSPEAKALGVEFVALEELLARSDFVSLHAALTPENNGLMNAARLKLMKKSACLINTARGQMIDEAALAAALSDGTIAGAALDVFSTEPLPPENPLRKAPNVILSPHQAGFARETGERVSAASAQAIVDLMNGKRPQFVVDTNVFQSPKLRAALR